MGAVYTVEEFTQQFAKQFQAVQTYFKNNPGKDISDCATSLNLTYQLVYAIVESLDDLIFLPSGSTEVSFSRGNGKGH